MKRDQNIWNGYYRLRLAIIIHCEVMYGIYTVQQRSSTVHGTPKDIVASMLRFLPHTRNKEVLDPE